MNFIPHETDWGGAPKKRRRRVPLWLIGDVALALTALLAIVAMVNVGWG